MGHKLIDLFNSETSTPRKVVFASFLYQIAKSSRIVFGTISELDDTNSEIPLALIKAPLLEIFSMGAAFGTEFNQLRFYCLSGLSELLLASGVLNKEEVM